MTGTFLEISNGQAQQRIGFHQDKFTIGRGPNNDVVLVDDLASRNHATIERVSGSFYVRDLESRNGTRHNGVRIAKVVALAPGDNVQIGRHVITLVVGEPAEVEDLDVLTADDLVEIEDDAPVTPRDVLPASMFSADADDAGSVQLSKLAANLPNHQFESKDIILTDAAGHNMHGGAPANAKKPQTPGEAVEMLRALLLVCCRARATDIHVEPRQDGYHIRLRIDGMMIDVAAVPPTTGIRLATVVKVLCQIDIAQRKAIQEGAFAAKVPDEKMAGKLRRLDYRVSFAPAVQGQKLVVRILDPGGAPAKMSDLGLPQAMLESVAKVIHRDAGMVLVAGPTGSGKTTTLYALLRSIDLAKRNVVTIEDPVEVHLDGITQIPVDESQDRSFLQVLRSVLRQDPDVILVGEIRDAETARVAMQAAITGHMVFSTVHTRDTIGTVFRLRDLGVEPYLMGQGLQLVVAQRLVRQLCPFCKKGVTPTARQREALGPAGAAVQQIFRPVGCVRCLNTGHSGRRAFFELLVSNEQLADAILSNPSRQEIINMLGASNFVSLRQSAYRLVAEGFVAFEEVEHDLGSEA